MLGIDKSLAASVKVETACGTNGERNGDMDGTNSGDDIDSQQVEAARLVVSPEPHTTPPEACYRVSRPSRRCARTMIEPKCQSVEREKSKMLTLDAHLRCGQCGRTKTDTEGRRTLLPSA